MPVPILLNRLMPGGRVLQHRGYDLNREQLTETPDTAEEVLPYCQSIQAHSYGVVTLCYRTVELRTFGGRYAMQCRCCIPPMMTAIGQGGYQKISVQQSKAGIPRKSRAA